MAVATATALALTAVALTAAGAGVGAYSSIQAGKASEDAAKYNAKIAENNAAVAARDAAAEAAQIRRQNLLRSGKQRAAAGKAGVDLSGSFEDVFFDTGAQGELEAMSALYAGEVTNRAFESRAIGSRFEGRQARAAGNIGAASSIIGGLGNAASIGARYSSAEPSFRSNTGRHEAQHSGQR